MSVTIETPGGHSMTVEDRRWSSEARPDLAEVFNAELEAGNLPVMPGDPDPDGNEALRVLEELGGGRIVTRTPVPAAQDGAVY